MNEALIARLGNLRQIVVRPASAVSRYAGGQGDAVAAGREQGVDAVLDGTIQRVGDRIRVTVQLLRVSDRALLWSGQFDESVNDIFAVQDSISRQVAQGLVLTLSDEDQRRLQQRGPANADAYQAYLRGRYFWGKRTVDAYKKATEHFQRALDLDPAYAPTYAGLADVTIFLADHGLVARKEALAKARAHLRRAIEIDDSLAEPHASLGLLTQNFDWDWAGAEREYRRAIELNPNYATAHHWYGEFLTYMGRFDEGLAEIKRAQEIDPLSLVISADVGKVLLLRRDYDRAIVQHEKTLEMDPNFDVAHAFLAFAFSLKDQHTEAIAELHKIEGLMDDPLHLSYLGYIYGAAGQRAEAEKVRRRLEVLAKQTDVPPFSMVMVYAGMAEKDEAFKWYDKVFAEHDAGALELKVNPILDNLRSDPRYAELLRRARFAP